MEAWWIAARGRVLDAVIVLVDGRQPPQREMAAGTCDSGLKNRRVAARPVGKQLID